MKKMKWSKHSFIVYYFNNIMDICRDDLDWEPHERAKEMNGIIYEYKKMYNLQDYSNVSIWKTIKRYYEKHWDVLHYDMMEFESNLNN